MAAGKWLGSAKVEIADNATTAAAVKSWSLGDVAAAWASKLGKLQEKLKLHGLYVADSSHGAQAFVLAYRRRQNQPSPSLAASVSSLSACKLFR